MKSLLLSLCLFLAKHITLELTPMISVPEDDTSDLATEEVLREYLLWHVEKSASRMNVSCI